MSGITSWHTGVPFSIGEGDQMDTGNTFDSERPNYVGGCNLYANQSPDAIGSMKPALCPRSMARPAIWEGTCWSGPGMRRRIFP